MKCNSYYPFFNTISTKIRIDIIQLLRKGPKNVSEICTILDEEQSKISHNLKELAECNIIQYEQVGKSRVYSLNKDTIEPILDLVDKHVSKKCESCKRHQKTVKK